MVSTALDDNKKEKDVLKHVFDKTPYENVTEKQELLPECVQNGTLCEASNVTYVRETLKKKENELNGESEDELDPNDVDVLYEDSQEIAELKRHFFFSELVELCIEDFAQQEQARLEAFHEHLFSLIPTSLHHRSVSSILETANSQAPCTSDVAEYSRLFDFFLKCSTLQPMSLSEATRILEDAHQQNPTSNSAHEAPVEESRLDSDVSYHSQPSHKWKPFSSTDASGTVECVEVNGIDGTPGVSKSLKVKDLQYRDFEMESPEHINSLEISNAVYHKCSTLREVDALNKEEDTTHANVDAESVTPALVVGRARESVVDTLVTMTAQSLRAALHHDESLSS